MSLVEGVHHVTILTEDIERLSFYRRVFDAKTTLDLTMGFHDPDGFHVEVIWRKPDVPDSETLPRAEWKTIELS